MGGAGAYVAALVAQYRSRHHFCFLHVTSIGWSFQSSLRSDEQPPPQDDHHGTVFDVDRVSGILGSQRPPLDVVLISEDICVPRDAMAGVARRLPCPYVVVLHDNHYLSPRADLDEPSAFAGQHVELLQRAQVVVTPSVHVRRTHRRVFPDARFRLIPHEDGHWEPCTYTRRNRDALHIAVVGHIVHPIKGSTLLQQLLEALPGCGRPIKVFVFGSCLPEHARLLHDPHAAVWPYTAGYTEIPDLCARCDIDLVLSLQSWPGTYSYTLTESMMAGRLMAAPKRAICLERLQDYRLKHWFECDAPAPAVLAGLWAFWSSVPDGSAGNRLVIDSPISRQYDEILALGNRGIAQQSPPCFGGLL